MLSYHSLVRPLNAWLLLITLSSLISSACAQQSAQQLGAERLWQAARSGDLEAVQRELDAGVDVNSPTAYQSTALSFACDRGHLQVVELLLSRGANPNVKDTFYNATPLTWAQSNKHYEVIMALLKSGVEGANGLLLDAINERNSSLAKAIISSGRVNAENLSIAFSLAKAQDSESLLELFEGLDFPKREVPQPTIEDMKNLTGMFQLQGGESRLNITLKENHLAIDFGFGGSQTWFETGTNEFRLGRQVIHFQRTDEKIKSVSLQTNGAKYEYIPVTTDSDTVEKLTDKKLTEPMLDSASAAGNLEHISNESDASSSSVHWPMFRGNGSRGIADGQRPPVKWDITEEENIGWRKPIPGFGNSCPVIWGNQLFVTSAVSNSGNNGVQIGIYGDVNSVDDDSTYDFKLYCLDKRNGDVLWERTCKSAKPAVKRHSKSSHANPTVVTDGTHVIAWFGSEGLYAFDIDGKPRWSRDLGTLDSGWFYDPSYQWGFGSSPVISGDQLYLQCDIQKGSFVCCLNLKTGDEIWRTERDEIPTWSTPVIHSFGDLPMLITHGTRAARGYDARDGKLLWWLGDHSEIVVPTPSVSHGFIYLSSGYAPIQPIVAVRPEARGELKLPGRKPKDGGETPQSEPGIAWSHQRGGPYMPSPIVYGDFLYILANNGVVSCYRAKSGEQIYKKRLIGGIQSFTASPIAADGHIYFTAEDGTVSVIKAGGQFEQVSSNPGNTKVLSTPAISEGTFFLRTTAEIIAIRDRDSP
jgi:outer membrane protein assembly factor BamB